MCVCVSVCVCVCVSSLLFPVLSAPPFFPSFLTQHFLPASGLVLLLPTRGPDRGQGCRARRHEVGRPGADLRPLEGLPTPARGHGQRIHFQVRLLVCVCAFKSSCTFVCMCVCVREREREREVREDKQSSLEPAFPPPCRFEYPGLDEEPEAEELSAAAATLAASNNAHAAFHQQHRQAGGRAGPRPSRGATPTPTPPPSGTATPTHPSISAAGATTAAVAAARGQAEGQEGGGAGPGELGPRAMDHDGVAGPAGEHHAEALIRVAAAAGEGCSEGRASCAELGPHEASLWQRAPLLNCPPCYACGESLQQLSGLALCSLGSRGPAAGADLERIGTTCLHGLDHLNAITS
jgi:hypothetical protein